MAEITAADVGKLRAMTGAGLMECKKALTEAGGDLDTAVDILRKKGVANAEKKAGREAKEGVIAHAVSDDRKSAVLLEINCETDFVAKNESFQAFCGEMAAKILTDPSVDLETERAAQVVKIGENIVIARNERLDVSGTGAVSTYIHTGAKVGVAVQFSAGKSESIDSAEFKQLAHDVALQIAATSPIATTRDEVDTTVVDREKDIVREQMKDKPPAAIENIIKGKLEKYFQTTCLVDQAFVKDSNVSIKDHVAAVAKQIGDELQIQRFVRFQVGG